MDEEPENQRQGSQGSQGLGGVKKAAENTVKEAGKEVRKTIIQEYKKYLLLFVIVILIGVLLWGALMNIIDHNKSKTSKEASSSALVYDFISNSQKDDEKPSTAIHVDINADKGCYEFSYTFLDENGKERDKAEVLEEIKKILEEDHKMDISELSDAELYIIGVLMEKGLQIDKYNAEELKCLVLFQKADIASRNLDLRPKDEIGKEISLEENQIYGTIQVHKTKVSDDGYNEETLEYMPFEEFDNKVQANDMSVINNFTIDEKNNLLFAKWNTTTVSYSYQDANGNPLSEDQIPEEYVPDITSTTNINASTPIDYQKNINMYTLNFSFLSDLLIVTQNTEFCTELCKMAFNSKIVINIQEQLTETTDKTITENTQTTKIYDRVKYNIIGQAKTTTQTSSSKKISNGTGRPTSASVGHGWNASINHTTTGDVGTSIGQRQTYNWSYGNDNYTLIYTQSTTSEYWNLYKKEATNTTTSKDLPKQSNKNPEGDLIVNYKENNDEYTDIQTFKYKIIVNTFSQNNSYKYEISDIDCWFAKYKKEYQSPKVETNVYNDSATTKGDFPNEKIEVLNTTDQSVIDADERVQTYKKAKEEEYKNGRKNVDATCNVTNLIQEQREKIDSEISIVTTTTKHEFGEEVADTTDIVFKNIQFIEDRPGFTKEDKEGNEETNSFLYLYDKYKMSGENLYLKEDAEKKLFKLLEENDNLTQAMLLKYLLYAYDGIDRGVIELDLSLFNPKEFKTFGEGVTSGMAIVEVLRSYENETLREYRNGTASQGTINTVIAKQLARQNPNTGEIEYGIYEEHYKQEHSLNYSYGLRLCSYKNGVQGKLEDKEKLFSAKGINVQEKINEYKSNSGRGWINADLADEVQVELINEARESIKKYFSERGVELTSNELDACTVIKYGYGNCYVDSATIQLLKDYKNGLKTEKDVIKGFKIPISGGGYFHPFTYGDWVNSGRAESIRKMFFEGRYFLKDRTEVFEALYGTWGGDVYVSKDFVFPIYSQHDPEWAEKAYGGPNGKAERTHEGQKTIASSGCGTCALASVISGFTGKTYTPAMMVDILDKTYPDGSYYKTNVGSANFYFSDNAKLITKEFNCRATAGGSYSQANQALRNGDCIILGIARGNGTGHVVAAVPTAEADLKRGYILKLIDPTGAGKGYDGLYKSIEDLKQKNGKSVKGDNYYIASVDIKAIINKGTNTPGVVNGTQGGITTNQQAKSLEQIFNKMLNVPGTFDNSPSYHSSWKVYNSLPNALKKGSRRPDETSGKLQMFQCTWWAYGRANLYLEKYGKNGIHEYPWSDVGNGGEWYLKNTKFKTGSTPRPNSIGCYRSGKYGHVFYVEGVTSSGIYISDCGSGQRWGGVKFWSNSVWQSKGIPGFIYLDSPK